MHVAGSRAVLEAVLCISIKVGGGATLYGWEMK